SDVGGKARRALVRGQHEIDAALSHRLHQRQHVAARNAEAAIDAGGLQGGDDEIGIVHEEDAPWFFGAMYHTASPKGSRGDAWRLAPNDRRSRTRGVTHWSRRNVALGGKADVVRKWLDVA